MVGDGEWVKPSTLILPNAKAIGKFVTAALVGSHSIQSSVEFPNETGVNVCQKSVRE